MTAGCASTAKAGQLSLRVRFAALLFVAGTLGAVAARAPTSPDGFDRIVIPTGHAPGSIAVADVNRDGKPDIVVANTQDSTVSVLLGDGRGHFIPATGSPFACGPSPNDIAVADMNRDGNPDLIVANTETPYISILLGDGKGGFAPSPHSPFATVSFPHVHGVVAADFMGNGKPAVITDSWGHDQILMIPSDGAGNLLLPGTLFHTGKRPYQRLRSADFNNDGKPDVVTTDLDANEVTVLLGDGHGGLREAAGSPFSAGAAPWSIAIGDLNRDGKLDLAVIPYDRSVTDAAQLGVTVLFGDGKGGFTRRPGAPLPLAGCRGPDRIATGDVNGDGIPDIVVSCAQNARLMLFLGSKSGAFQSSTLEVKTGWSGLAVADLWGDGHDEIIVSNGALDNDPKNQPGTVTIFSYKREQTSRLFAGLATPHNSAASKAINYLRGSWSMLLELAKPVALILCLLSLYAVFHTLFLSIEDPHLILLPHKAFDDRILDSVLLLVLSAAISLLGGIIFREAEPYPQPRLATTLPLLIFYWATGIMTALFFAAWFLETHYIFSPTIHW